MPDDLDQKTSIPVTDPHLDAPEGAVIAFEDGIVRERGRDSWEPVAEKEPRPWSICDLGHCACGCGAHGGDCFFYPLGDA